MIITDFYRLENENEEQFIWRMGQMKDSGQLNMSSIVDLWSEMLEKENDVIQSSIDKHEELLDAKKRNDEYSRNVRKQQKDINAIQAQISALSGV